MTPVEPPPDAAGVPRAAVDMNIVAAVQEALRGMFSRWPAVLALLGASPATPAASPGLPAALALRGADPAMPAHSLS